MSATGGRKPAIVASAYCSTAGRHEKHLHWREKLQKRGLRELTMARSRNIKPGFFKNELLAEMSAEARLLFIGLWCIADREGRFEDRPKKIKMELFPAYSFDLSGCIDTLATGGFLIRYEADGTKYVQIVNFTKHQMPHHKEVASVIPAVGCSPHHQVNVESTLNQHQVNVGSTLRQEQPKQVAPCPTDCLLLIPSSLIPDSSPLIPDPTIAPTALSGKPAQKRAPKPAAPSSAVWDAYADAYQRRYSVQPVRNASVNAHLSQVVGRLGADEAPAVAAHFVGSQNGLYVAAMHPTNLLLRDAEKLRTEWATGRGVTRTQAMMADKTQTNFNSFAPLIAAAEAREAAERQSHE